MFKRKDNIFYQRIYICIYSLFFACCIFLVNPRVPLSILPVFNYCFFSPANFPQPQKPDSNQKYVIFYRNDESNFCSSPEELLAGFKDIVENRIGPKLLTVFHSLPAAELEIVEVAMSSFIFMFLNLTFWGVLLPFEFFFFFCCFSFVCFLIVYFCVYVVFALLY